MTNSVVKCRAKKAEFPLMQIDLKACRETWRGKVIHSSSASTGRELLPGRGWVWWCRLAEITAVDLSPRKALSGNHSQQEHFYIPAQLYSSLVGEKNLILFFKVFFFLPYAFPLHFM